MPKEGSQGSLSSLKHIKKDDGLGLGENKGARIETNADSSLKQLLSVRLGHELITLLSDFGQKKIDLSE